MTHDLHYLEDNQSWDYQETPKKRKLWRNLIFILLGLLLVWVLLSVIFALQVGAALLDGRDAIEKGRQSALNLDFEESKAQMRLAKDKFQRAGSRLDFLSPLSVVPKIRHQYNAIDSMVNSSEAIVGALIEVVDLGSEIVELTGITQEQLDGMKHGVYPTTKFADLPTETKRLILQRLANSGEDLLLIDAKIEIAKSELEELPKSELVGPIVGALEPFVNRLNDFSRNLRLLSFAAEVVPEFVGLNDQKNDLVLFLNNSELRPGGGFIGVFGLMGIKDSEITSLKIEDVYALDDAAAPFIGRPAPEPLKKYNAADVWYFRDGNWSPDFALSSRSLLSLLGDEVESLPSEIFAQYAPTLPVHNILGMTPNFAANLLEVIGPIEAHGLEFDSHNVRDLLEYEVEFGFKARGQEREERKAVVAALVENTKARLEEMSIREWAELVPLLEGALASKQVVLFSENQQVEDLISKVGWGGRVFKEDGRDVQMVVDANLASLKTDPYVKRHIKYEIYKNNAGEFLGRTTISYDHQGQFDFKTSRYRSYTRLYLPKGTEFIKVTGSLIDDQTKNPTLESAPVDISEELGLLSLGTFVAIEPGQTRDLIFEYKLSDEIVKQIQSGWYQLDYLKQVGAFDHELTLELDFDKNVTHANPSEDQSQWGDTVYHLNTILDQDLEFEVGI